MPKFTRLAGWLLIVCLVGLIFASLRNRQVAASLTPASTPWDSWRLLVAITRHTEGHLVEESQVLSSGWKSAWKLATQQAQGILQTSHGWRTKLAILAHPQRVNAAQPAAAQPLATQVGAGTAPGHLPYIRPPAPTAAPRPEVKDNREPSSPVKPAPSRVWPARQAHPVPPASQPVERLRIPVLQIDVPVVAVPFDQIGWNLDDVQQEVALLGSLTGEPSSHNLVLAGHITLRNMSHGPFRYLHWLKPGDLLMVDTSRTVQTYQVREQIVVKPEDVSVTENTSEHQLTLITCTDWSEELELYQRRRVVLADLVSVEPKKENRQ